MKGYDLLGLLHLVRSLIITKLFYPSIKLARLPISIRGKKCIDFGENLITGRYCRIDSFNVDGKSLINIKFGKDCQINDSVHIAAINNTGLSNIYEKTSLKM